MSATILDALENAEYNFKKKITFEIAMSQLHNAIILLDKGYNACDEIEPLLNGGKVEDVPEQEY